MISKSKLLLSLFFCIHAMGLAQTNTPNKPSLFKRGVKWAAKTKENYENWHNQTAENIYGYGESTPEPQQQPQQPQQKQQPQQSQRPQPSFKKEQFQQEPVSRPQQQPQQPQKKKSRDINPLDYVIPQKEQPTPRAPRESEPDESSSGWKWSNWGYGDKENPSWGQKGLNFLGAGATFGHSTVGHTGNIVAQGASKTMQGIGWVFNRIGTAVDTSKDKNAIALGFGYAFLGWALYRLYKWRSKDGTTTTNVSQTNNSRSWATFLLPDWAMKMFGWDQQDSHYVNVN